MLKNDEMNQKTVNTLGKRNPRKLAVGYARVSTVGQGDNGISMEAQKTSIKEFAERAGYTLVEIFEDVASGVGAKSYSTRDGLRRALDMAVRERSHLIVWDWDRLSRYSNFEKQILKHLPGRDQVICAKNGTVLVEAAKHAAFKHSEVVATEISRRTKEGMRKRREEGAVFGNPEIRTKVQPLGSARWSETSKKLDHKIADVLREQPDPFASTYAEVADLLNMKGLQTLQRKEWNKSRVRQPVARAREILRREEEAQQETSIRFGMF
jgi:DNA invertase Pin-like site-specific DNA recombinase